MEDFQKSKVYNFENTFVAPFDKNKISFDSAQSIIDYIWSNEGFKNTPPKAIFKVREGSAYGSRMRIRLPNNLMYTWVVVHEMVHSIQDMAGNEHLYDGHGPNFVGIYVDLLDKYLKINKLMLWAKIEELNIKINRFPLINRN